jgi:hypothetical protein
VADRVDLEFLGEAFNVANHQNVTGVNTTAYTVGSVSATKTNTLTYTTAVPTFGATTFANTSGFSFAPRQIQLGVRASSNRDIDSLDKGRGFGCRPQQSA